MLLTGFLLFIFLTITGALLLIFGKNKPTILILGKILLIIGVTTLLVILIFFLRNFK